LCSCDFRNPEITSTTRNSFVLKGCNEQTFSSWIPNIAALRYLKSTGHLTKNIEKTALVYLNTGYQKLLTLSNSNGYYSFWQGYEPNIWLTAYIAKLLFHIKDYQKINPKLISDALTYVARKQNPDGSFPLEGIDYFSRKSGDKIQEIPLSDLCDCFL
jgi:hypothetical protein